MQLDCLMEKLRSKNRRQKTAIEAIKIFHTVSNDRKSGFDLQLLHAQLNSLRSSINVGKTSYTLDRLESVSSQCGLKFSSDINRGEAFCSCDIFGFKFSVNEQGSIEDVIILINSDSRPCHELLKSLRAGNYNDLKHHIEGLNSINDISSDKKTKSKIVMALQSLESDLNSLSMYQNSIPSIQSYVHRSPLGILVPRIGGLPMKLIYFVGPYDLLNKQNKTMIPMTLEAIIENNVGYSLTVGIEKSIFNNRIQTSTLMLTNNSPDGKNLPIFPPLNNSNSSMLPARFVVNLKEPLVLSWNVINKIQHITGIKIIETTLLRPVVSLLIERLNQGNGKKPDSQSDNGSALVIMPAKKKYVCFPNPINHNLLGCVVDKIAFTHPTHLPTIVAQLRQQILFNTLVCSCVKSMAILTPSSMKEFTTRQVQFEVVPLSLQLITATFQHPFKESLLTIMLELNDSISVTCKITGEHIDTVVSSDYVTKVTQRCLSLPVVIRSIFKKSPHLQIKLMETSVLPPLIHLSRQTSCLLPSPYASSTNKKFLTSKSLEIPGDEVKIEHKSSIKISVPKLLANFSVPKTQSFGDEVIMKMEQNADSCGNNSLHHNLVPSASYLTMSGGQDVKIRKEIVSKSSESDVEIIEKPPSVTENNSFTGRPMSVSSIHKADKVSSNPMLASLLDQSSGNSSLGPTGVQNIMGVNITGLANVGTKQRKRPATNDWGSGTTGGRNIKRSKQATNILSDEYFHQHQFQQLQQQQQQHLMSRNQMSGVLDGGNGKLNPGNAGMIKMTEVERSMAVMARQMSDPTSFQNFAAWQNSSNCTTSNNIGGMSNSNVSGQVMRQQSSGGGTYFDKDAMFTSNLAQQQHLQSRVQPKDQFKGNLFDGNTKQFSSNESESSGNDSVGGAAGKSGMTSEMQPPIKVRLDKRTFTSTNSSNTDIGRLTASESSVSSSPLSTGMSDMKCQMSSSLTDLLSDDNNHSNSADSEVGILTSGNAGMGSVGLSNLSIVSRCSSSPRLSIKRVGDVRDLAEMRTGILNANLGNVAGHQPPLKKIKSTGGLGKTSEEKKAKRMYACNSVSMDEATKQKLSKKQKIYEFDDDECIVTASTSPITSHVSTGMPTIKITNAGGKLKIQNPLKSKQVTAGLAGITASRSGQLSNMIVGQKSPKAFGSHHVQGHHQRLGKATVRPKSIETKVNVGSDQKGLARTLSQTFIQSSPSPVTMASTSPFQTPSSITPQQYQQAKFRPTQCTTPLGFSAISTNSNSASSTVMSTSKFNLSASAKTSSATPSTSTKSKSPSASGEGKSGGKKGSLSLVIDTLMKKQHSVSGADGPRGPEGAVAQKEIYDAIRLEIIREGNKPSTPTRDQLAASTSAKLNNNSKKLESSSFQSRTPSLSQFQPISKSHVKGVSSKSPSPNNFSAASANPGTVGSASGKPLITASAVSVNKLNSKSDIAFNKPMSFNAGFVAPSSSSSSPQTSTPFYSSSSNSQSFASSRSTTEALDVTMKSSSSTPQPLLPSPILPPASSSLLGFSSRVGPAGQNQRSTVLSSQVIGTRYQEKSPLKMQPPFNPDVTLKMMKLNDISDRLVASRHFLDVVGNVDNTGASNANIVNPCNPNATQNAVSCSTSTAVVERLLSPPRSPSPGLVLPACASTSPHSSPNKPLLEDQPREVSCIASNQSERCVDEFSSSRAKSGVYSSTASGIICSASSMSLMSRAGNISPVRMLSEQSHSKSQKHQSKEYDDVVTVDDEKSETPDNDLVIDVSPSSSPVLEAAGKISAALSELSSQQPPVLPMHINAPAPPISTYLLDLTNSPPSSVQSEINNPSTSFSMLGRPASNWVNPIVSVHKSPPSGAAGQKSQPSSVNSVVCELDDELMNEALIM